MSADLLERCIRASTLCAKACEAVLAADVSYTTPGTKPYDRVHLALVSCTSVCSLLVRALQENEGDLELLRWCAEICAQFTVLSPHESVPAAQWSEVVRTTAACAGVCLEIVDRVVLAARQTIGASQDTDYGALAKG